MTHFLDIHAEFASIMDILAKSAVAEISRLVDDGAALLRLEISRSHREIATLRRNLQLKESELQAARRLQERLSQERVFGQEWSFSLRRDGEPAGVAQVDSPLQSGVTQKRSTNKGKVGPEPVLFKPERLEEDLSYSDPQPTAATEEQVTQPRPVEDWKKLDIEPTPAGDPEELSAQHRCEHGDEELSELEFVVKAEQDEEHVVQRNQPANMEVRPEPVLIKEERLEENSDPQPTAATEEQVTPPMTVEDGKKLDIEPTPAGDPEELSEQHRFEHGNEELSGLQFVVKAEQEEEHVAQRLNQTEYEHSAGRLNNLGSEYVMYERDSQLWTSFTQEDSDIETDDPVCSNATEQCSRSLLVHTQLQNSPAPMGVSGKMLSSLGVGEKSSVSVCSEELGSEVINRPQGQCRSRRGSLTKEDIVSPYHQPQPQFSESNPDASEGDRCAPQAQVEMRGKAYRRAGTGEKRFSCVQCGKSFTTRHYLKIHRRIHTGEKRFSCAQCGKSFTTRPYLKIHRRIHTGERPFNCMQCGKSFYCTSHLTSHQRSHTGEKPYSCNECGNSYSHLKSFKRHYRVHADKRELGSG